MDALFQSLSQTTPPQWLQLGCLLIILFFLKRLVVTFDAMQKDIFTIKESVVEQATVSNEHEKRLNRLDDKIFG